MHISLHNQQKHNQSFSSTGICERYTEIMPHTEIFLLHHSAFKLRNKGTKSIKMYHPPKLLSRICWSLRNTIWNESFKFRKETVMTHSLHLHQHVNSNSNSKRFENVLPVCQDPQRKIQDGV